ncbi:efflux RND transporter permease subunit [Bacillus sp. Marseille-Q1617]|uniref:efflux RND transporter permease subunit n=1 Tax=Bacillus sp. Marseille-Q1617 TaxID=2736887 RepID=UPI00158D084C|nr:efflux RND transporter permease subunit [Bacillus sp. Marseille-Q1617]
MNLLKFIVNRKILVGLMVLLVLVIGGYSVFKLDKELLPPIQFDAAYVDINAGDMSAIEVERTITNPLEQQINGIEGVEKTESTTYIGRSSIMVTFERGKGDELSKEVEALANAAAADNTAIKEVVAGQAGLSQSYEFFMDVSGEDMGEITAFSRDILEPRLEALPEVSDVLLSGIEEKEVAIEFNRDKVSELGIDISQTAAVISGAGGEETLGELSGEADSPTIRWSTKLENTEDVKNILIPTSTGFVRLEEVASVSVQPLDTSSIVWKNGTKDFIFIQVGRVSEVTQIEMAEAVRKEIQAIRDEGLVDGFTVNEVVSQADYVKESLDGVTGNIVIGGIIAVVILFLFLRNLRATFIIGLSIPTSVFLTFATMFLFDYSFNMLTLVGLGLGIGMMVDSSIVILESIYKKKEQGMEKFEAVIAGTKEVASAVFASMLTTIVVFLPIGLVGGEMGQFMILLSAVVAITLISSVVVAFTLIPSLSENFLKLREKTKARKEGRITGLYSRMVSWTVKKKRTSFAVIGLFFMMFAASLFLITKVPMTIMPDMFNRYAELMVKVETGLSLQEKEDVVGEMTDALAGIPDVETSYVLDNGSMLYTIINMTKGDDITEEQEKVNEQIFSSLRDLEESTPIENVASAMNGGGGYPVQVNISGDDFEGLRETADNFTKELEEIEGITGVTTSIDRTSLEQVVDVKEDEIEAAGLTQSQIKQFIQQAFLEVPVGEMSIDNDAFPLLVKWNEKTDMNSELLNLIVSTPKGEEKLSSFIELRSVDTPNEISHADGDRFISVFADIKDKDLGAINREVQKMIKEFRAPAGYTVAVAGDLEQQQELIQEMILVLAIAIFLVYFVMAVQFNNLSQPIVVMSVIPMTITGVILGLFITQRELSVMSGMGIVMLIGIVLNNAILLIDRTNQLRKEGLTVEEALVRAGKDRVRPIFMTTLTTAGGMLPLALASGTSGNYQAPMATVIISGLLFATLITLVLIPSVYKLFASLGAGFKRAGRRKKKYQTSTAEKLETLN